MTRFTWLLLMAFMCLQSGSVSGAVFAAVDAVPDETVTGTRGSAENDSGSEPANSEPLPSEPADGNSAALPATRSFHHQIDRLIERGAAGPLAPVCSDSEFLRRVSLDLAGLIPTPQDVAAFLADQHPDKRQQLIDQLLQSSDFVRHLATQLDLMLLERRTDKYVPEPDWEAFLLTSIANRKPLNQLYQELIFPDSRDEPVPAAAKFILNREAEPNAVTRDVGRLMFGMDLQCAQCHDHPLIGDYYQRDYYGLFAFLQRTGQFTDPASKKVRLSEKPLGEASFTSVFTGQGRDWARPRIPRGSSVLEEPLLVEGDEYQVAPQKNVPGVPVYSRRKVLAEMLSDSRLFRRNLANRLWALMYGRGLVHPLDVHHADNPPSNPELLDLLTEMLETQSFDLRGFLKQLAMTRAYQRSSAEPQPDVVNFSDIAARAVQLQGRADQIRDSLAPLKQSLADAEADLAARIAENDKLRPELLKVEKEIAATDKQIRTTAEQLKRAKSTLSLSEQQVQVLAQAAEQARQAATQLPSESVLDDAIHVLQNREKEAVTSVEKAQSLVAKNSADLAALKTTLQEQHARRSDIFMSQGLPDQLASLEARELAARNQLDAAQAELQMIESQLAICSIAADYDAARGVDPEKAEILWRSLLEQWTLRGQIGALKPLTPEQLALSSLRAVGVLDPQIASLQAKLTKSPPKELANAAEADREGLLRIELQKQIINQTRSTVRQFVTTYGGGPGEEFQATVGQALFLGNSSLVNDWMSPSGDKLAARLINNKDDRQMIDELYMAILSRPADEQDRQDLTSVLAAAPDDREPIVRELIWALLSSNEFRFNY